ncbi:MAG: ribonuclease P protein component [Candidatus Portnoybacteria bacterium]|nr:ribonuclease P protein component [Candidatus Portnoybacteria bacterium]
MLPFKYRLTKKNDFERVFRKGRRFDNGMFVLTASENGLQYSRFGFAVGLKVSKKATARNKIRRQLQETIRMSIGDIKGGFDIVILARPTIKRKTYAEVYSAIRESFKKGRLVIS